MQFIVFKRYTTKRTIFIQIYKTAELILPISFKLLRTSALAILLLADGMVYFFTLTAKKQTIEVNKADVFH